MSQRGMARLGYFEDSLQQRTNLPASTVPHKTGCKMSNMYKLSVRRWNPWVGCKFDCVYCKPSFQAQLKRQKHRCRQCYNYEPHMHPERLGQRLPNTKFMQFIFACSNGDIAFCPTRYLEQIVRCMELAILKTFLLQSKNPATFNRVGFPIRNVILGTTIETNRDDLAKKVSKAPPPSIRIRDFLQVRHPLKMLTIEPVMDFDLEKMVAIVEAVNPVMVWMGYDSKKCNLPEPYLHKFKHLHWELAKKGFTVMLKTVREATFTASEYSV